MASYRIRNFFRALAGVVALAALVAAWLSLKLGVLPGGLAFMVAVVLMLGFAALFGWLAWRGRAPAWLEEYGLDDPEEVAENRADAARRGDYQP